MGLFNRNKVQPTEVPQQVSQGDSLSTIINLSLQTTLPKVTEVRGKEWVDYTTQEGEFYPTYLGKLYETSPTHSAICQMKALLTAGDGYTYDDTMLSEQQKAFLNQLLHYTDGKNGLDKFINEASFNLQIHGGFYVEIIWSLDFSSIVKVKCIHNKNIKSGKFYDGEVCEYFYSRNWSDRQEEITCIKAFNIQNKEDARQMFYIGTQMVNNEYYFESDYIAATNYINLEAQLGVYYDSLLTNGFNPSMVIKFFNKPDSQEAKDEIVSGLKKTFGSVKNSGKAIVLFSNNKETAPEITPLEVSNLDKQYLELNNQIKGNILTAHRVTSTELLGVNTAGQLGNSDFGTQVEVFQTFTIKPKTKIIETFINKLFKLNGLDVNLQITPYTITSIKPQA